MTARVTISLPDDLLGRLDAEAAELGESRSFVVQEATARYLSKTREERDADERRARALEAVQEIREMARRNPHLDGRPSLEILREVRETDDSAPLRGVEAVGPSEDDE